ncbi:MAG TPA: DUF2147 domain-containing protein [Aliiroseovarius sp.]|nr:DUF2147 domain-containing protein [Aliiroseovarius sp.]
MKKIVLGLVMAIFAAFPALADPLVGLWKTDVDDGAYAYVNIQPCGSGFCGTITRTFNSTGEYQSENIGKDIIRNMVPAGGGKYNGNVWRPSNGKIYVGKLRLKGNSLKMSGCVAGGLICKSSNWTRIQ